MPDEPMPDEPMQHEPMPDEPMQHDTDPGDWERLHPATILSLIASNATRLFIAFLFLLGGAGRGWRDGLDLIIGVLFIGPPLVTYMTSRYRLDAAAVHWQRGLLFRQRRDLPRNQIQSVETSIGVIGRLFGLETLTISTAGGGSSEIVIGLISHDTAHRLRIQLTPGPVLAPPPVAVPAPPFYPGASADGSSPPLAPPPFASSVQAPPPPQPELEHVYAQLRGGDAPRVALVNLGPRMIGVAVRSYGLKAIRFGDRIRTTSGLVRLETRETTRERIQGLERRQSLIARRTGTEEIAVDTADASGVGATTSLLLNPIAPAGRWESVASDLVGSVIAEDDLVPVAPAALRRRRVRAVFQSTATATIYGGYVVATWLAPQLAADPDDLGDRRSMLTVGALVLFALDLLTRQWCAGRRHRHHRYALDPHHVAVQQGCVATTLTVVPRTSTQAVTVRANYFQRRLGLATVAVDNTTLALGAVAIVDVTDAEARRLAAELLSGFVSRPA
jgi:putative membrane protein